MTDREIICTFMEPKPVKMPCDYRPWKSASDRGWWQAVGPICDGDSTKLGWVNVFTACRTPREWPGMLWEVEERLTDEQWREYGALLWASFPRPFLDFSTAKGYLHATPEQKIKALAAVLRPVVEAV